MMIEKMTSAFQKAEGGLFSAVPKADVGNVAEVMAKNGIALMCWADPFYPAPSTPPHVVKATVDAIESGKAAHYTMPIGNPDLKEAVAKHLRAYNGLEVDPQRNIIITPGSDAGLFFAMVPFIGSGDEVLVIDPSYPNNFQNVEICGGVVVPVPAYAKDNFHPPIEEFERRITPRTKMVVLTNPNNPTTTVYRHAWMEELAALIVRHDLVCVVDQAFEFPVYDGLEMVTMAALPGMWERTLTVCSLSKGMGLSGFRVGYIVADDLVMDKLFGTAVSVIGASNTASQIGAIAAFEDDSFLCDYVRAHLERRDLVYSMLSGLPGVGILKQESGFLTWLDISALGSSQEVCDYLMKEAKVAINVGTPYGRQGEGHVRIVHGVLGGLPELKRALTGIRQALLCLAAEKGIR